MDRQQRPVETTSAADNDHDHDHGRDGKQPSIRDHLPCRQAGRVHGGEDAESETGVFGVIEFS